MTIRPIVRYPDPRLALPAQAVTAFDDALRELASDLRDKKVGDLLSSAAEFGRSQPVIMLAGAALLASGLVLLQQSTVSALLLFAAAALIGLATREKSALAVQH